MLGLGLLVVAIIVMAGWLLPMSFRAAVANLGAPSGKPRSKHLKTKG
jgi:hypothetical protein